VATAEARDPDVRFRLESVVPAAGALAAQQQALNAASAEARAVMDAMGVAGISPERVTLAARTDPTVQRSEIRLYRA
jgi:dihydroxyacetone kinase